jgi:hypothetical protein
MVWAGPVVAWVLPAFREGVAPLRILALGALMLSGATLPGYFVLAGGPRGRLLVMAIGMALLTGLLVFWVAAHDHRPVSIAMAAAAGYAGFAIGLVGLAAPGLCADLAGRAWFVAASFVPGLWAGGLALAACAVGTPESPGAAVLRSLAVVAAYLPVMWWFGRGVGLRRLAHEWRAGRVATT